MREERASEKTTRRYVFIMVTLETKNFIGMVSNCENGRF